MRLKAFSAVSLLASVVWAGPALAQDEAPFTGPYIGGVFGWDNVSSGNRDSDSKDDVTLGVDAGYDYQFDNWVVGGEAELTESGLSATFHNLDIPGDELRLDMGRDIYIGVRGGYVVNPQLLIYAKAGYTNLKVDANYDSHTGFLSGDNNYQDGYRLGLGVEYTFAGGFFAKGEYRYSHYGQNVGDFDVDFDRNQIVIGAGYRFK